MMHLGTRESKLALWQAQKVQSLLAEQNHETELVLISSEGDVNLTTPLYEIGIQGIFTKTLDVALLQNKIDIAVHSYKDVPTILAKGLCVAAVLERGHVGDVFVPGNLAYDFNNYCVIATSSMRRKAQWLNKYRQHAIDNIRGNVPTRLQKVKESNWTGAVFAKAGLVRLNLLPLNAIDLEWMLPAPAQGAVVVICRENDEKTKRICKKINHRFTAMCTHAERLVLSKLNAGCSLPVGALAIAEPGSTIFLRANVCSPDGEKKIEWEGRSHSSNLDEMINECTEHILEQGADKILNSLNRN